MGIAQDVDPFPPLPPLSHTSPHRFTHHICLTLKVELLAGLAEELEALSLPAPLVGETFPFEAALEAVRRLQGGQTVGKVVLEL